MVKVRFCGNCNPDVHPKKVKEILDEKSPAEDGEMLVDGCTRACLSKKILKENNKNDFTVMSAKEIVRRHG